MEIVSAAPLKDEVVKEDEAVKDGGLEEQAPMDMYTEETFQEACRQLGNECARPHYPATLPPQHAARPAPP